MTTTYSLPTRRSSRIANMTQIGAGTSNYVRRSSRIANNIAKQDKENVYNYALMLENEGVNAGMAYNVALDTFLSNKNEFRKRISRIIG